MKKEEPLNQSLVSRWTKILGVVTLYWYVYSIAISSLRQHAVDHT